MLGKGGIRRLALLLGLLAMGTAAGAQGMPRKPPPAPVQPFSRDFYGMKISDPYHYMDNLKDPKVRAWINSQGQYTRARLDRIPGRAKLLAEVTKLDESEPARVGQVVVLPGDLFFYLDEIAGENTYRLYRRDGLSGKPGLLVDPMAFNEPGRPPATISFFSPSPDGHYVAFGISRGGTGMTTIHVVDARTGQPLPDTISDVRFPAAAWLPDGHSFFYNRLAPHKPGAPATAKYERSRVYLHELGTSPADDLPILGAGVVPGMKIAATDIPWVDIAPGSRYAVGVLENGVSHTLVLYTAPLQQVGTSQVHWQRVGDSQTHILDYSLRGNRLYLLVAGREGPAVANVSLAKPSVYDWGLMLQLSPYAGVTGMQAASDAIYLSELHNGNISLVRLPYDAAQEIKRVKLPFAGNVHLYPQDPRVSGALVMLSSWTRAPSIYRYDPQTHSVIHTDLWPTGPYDDPKNVVAINVNALSANGVLVPLTIVYKRGTQRDGTHPTLLIGYGSYSVVLAPVYTPLWRVWLDRGGVLAFAHVRGGGEYGALWRFEGSKVGLASRFHDYLTCAQYLVDQGYTTPRLLAGMSGSAGAILVGRAITARPHLFRAVVIESGLLDLLGYQRTANGVMNVPEFGSTKTLAGFDALYSVSSYNHVQPHVRYPAVLLEVGMNDPRVGPWQSAKMAARLQADTTSNLPVLLGVHRRVGHFLASTAEQERKLFTDEMSFLFWQLGLPGFQPAATPMTESATAKN
jgi:prolyl oligopeptidase